MAFNLSDAGITCSVLVKDSVTGKRLDSENPYRAILKCLRENVTNELFMTLSGRRVTNNKYNVNMLKGVYRELEDEGILVFGFRKPGQDLMLITDVRDQAKSFVKSLFDEIVRSNIQVTLDKSYDPGINGYLGLKCFDRNTLDLHNLNVLIMEYCVLPSLSGHINNLPLSLLSLTGSTLGSNQCERDVFWDWMCLGTIGETLQILEMNRVGLKSVPYEILNLKNLHTLSLAENQLISLPYFIGELNRMDRLFINDNSIMYLPICLHEKAFKDFNFSNNKFDEYEKTPRMKTNQLSLQEKIRILRKNGKPFLYSLFYLSLFTIIDNRIKICKDNLPPGLYQKLKALGEKLVRCQHCKKLLLPEQSFECFEKKLITSRNLMANDIIAWNTYECTFKCSKLSDIEFNLM